MPPDVLIGSLLPTTVGGHAFWLHTDVRRASDHTTPDQTVIGTDCGTQYLPRASGEGKMRTMSPAAAILRQESA